MKPIHAATPLRLAALLLATALAGCSTIEGWFSSDKTDYRKTAAKTAPLEVPPDLSQLARESRYQPQGGVISASGVAAPGTGANAPAGMVQTSAAAAMVPGSGAVAPASLGAIRIERQGQQRWLVAPQTPEQLWPLVKNFWEQRGFTLTVDSPKTGVMETDWLDDRNKLPGGTVRNALSKLLGGIVDSGLRDMYRTRIERTEAGTEVYISHRGTEEVYVGDRKEDVAWRNRPNDPQLEAEMLAALMVALGSKEEPASTAVAAAPDQPAKARVVATGQATSMVVDEPFDRAWRRVGLALDRGGFTVEDRDRAAGLYYVRYIDPKSVGKDEPGWWSRLWGDSSNPQAALRYRIQLKGAGDKATNLTVQTATGATDVGENAKRIVSLLANELR